MQSVRYVGVVAPQLSTIVNPDRFFFFHTELYLDQKKKKQLSGKFVITLVSLHSYKVSHIYRI